MKRFLIIYCMFVVSSFEVLGEGPDVENTNDGKIIELNQDNLNQTIENNDYVFINVYAPWSKEELEEEYEKTADILKENPTKIILAELNMQDNVETAMSLQLWQYPSLVLFRKGVPVEYFGKRTADKLTAWILKKIGPPAKVITSVEEVKSFINSAPVVIIGFFKDQESDEAQIYLSVALQANFVQFGITSADIVFSEFDANENSVILFKEFDDGNATFTGEFNDENLRKFVQFESQRLVVDEENPDPAEHLCDPQDIFLYIFLSKQTENFDKYVNEAKPVAKEFRDIRFIAVNVDSERGQDKLEEFSVRKNELPAVRILTYAKEGGVERYKPEDPEYNANNIKNFVQSFTDNQLKQYFPSQDLPADWDKNPVKVLVSSNYDSVTLDESKIVFVDFYTPWCKPCKKLEPVIEEVAEKLQSRDDIVIAKLNSQLNKLEHVRIRSYPTLKLYPKGNKEAIQYKGKRTSEELIKFIESEGAYHPTTPSKKETTTEKGKTTKPDESQTQTASISEKESKTGNKEMDTEAPIFLNVL